jgi:hypothetical protein
MKKSIEWHKKCLVSSTLHAKAKREQLERELSALERLDKENSLAQAQIDLAIKEGKNEFDEEKYAIKRLCV